MAESFYSNLEPLKFNKSLVYPSDLGGEFYPDCVCFTIQKRTGVSIDDVTDAVGVGATTATNMMSGNKLMSNEKIPKELSKAMAKVLKDEPNQKKQAEGMQAAIDTYKKTHDNHGLPEDMFDIIGQTLKAFGGHMQDMQIKALKLGKSGANILGSIYLNMPNGIQFNEAASWSGTELGFMGKMAKDLVSGGGDLGKTAVGAIAGGAGSLVGGAIGALPALVSKLGIGGGMFGAAIGAMAAGSPMQKGAEAALGIAQNPYMEMMFSGVGFRKFQFEFIMRPKSTKEVTEVAEILKKFRTFTKPTFTEGALGKAFMDYPMEFQIEFLTSGEREYRTQNQADMHYSEAVRNSAGSGSYKTNTNVPKLKNCVCDNVTSNFTPQSIWAAHAGGVPVAVTLGLSFQETELVMAEDVMGTTPRQGGQANKGGY
jgi:hypothetical protein